MQTLCWMVYWVEQDHWLRQFPGSKLGTDWRYFPGSCDLDRAQFSRWPVWNKWVYLYVAADCSQPRRSKYTRSAHVQRHTRLSCCLPMRPSATRRRCKSAQNDILVPNDQPTPTAPAHYHTNKTPWPQNPRAFATSLSDVLRAWHHVVLQCGKGMVPASHAGRCSHYCRGMNSAATTPVPSSPQRAVYTH